MEDTVSRDYRMFAGRLGVPEVTTELPRIRDELRNVALAAVGDDPSVVSLIRWAARHGAPIYRTLSPNATMVITADPERAARRKPVQDHGLVVRAPGEAEARSPGIAFGDIRLTSHSRPLSARGGTDPQNRH
ncbi:hypothetical protein ACFV98_42495 [Streptomyces violascens]|uniref:hypothetical protein n=1 Tax=Streptomyces violascens TaxID=67381 RepID=UPI00366A4019